MSTPQQDQSQLSDDLAVAAGASPHHEEPAHSSQLGQPLLQVRDLRVAYGQIQAVKGISFDLPLGRITTLVGANGAGKSTTLLALSGLVKKAGGSVDFDGQDLSTMAPHRIVQSGVVQVAEGRATLTTLTVHENLELGAYTRRISKAEREAEIERIYQLFPRLKERAGGLAGNMSGGEQQMLAIGRALMAKPRLLLLDEPSMGLSPIMVDKIFEVVKEVYDQGMTVLLVEQNASRALALADRGYVMDSGLITMTGKGSEMLDDPKVRAAYLGE